MCFRSTIVRILGINPNFGRLLQETKLLSLSIIVSYSVFSKNFSKMGINQISVMCLHNTHQIQLHYS